MDGRNEQRLDIKFCFKASLFVTETVVLVQKSYGNEDLNQSHVFRWYSWFWDGRDLVEDDKRGGHPKSTWTKVNIITVADFVKKVCRIASRTIAKSLNIPKTWILKEDMGKRKFCARFLYSLTPEQRGDRVTSSQDIIALADADKNFLTQLLQEMRPGGFLVTPKQSDKVMNGLVRYLLCRRNLNSKGPAPRSCW